MFKTGISIHTFDHQKLNILTDATHLAVVVVDLWEHYFELES